jgi:hypothetical protein
MGLQRLFDSVRVGADFAPAQVVARINRAVERFLDGLDIDTALASPRCGLEEQLLAKCVVPDGALPSADRRGPTCFVGEVLAHVVERDLWFGLTRRSWTCLACDRRETDCDAVFAKLPSTPRGQLHECRCLCRRPIVYRIGGRPLHLCDDGSRCVSRERTCPSPK